MCQSAKAAHHALRRLITNRMYARKLTWNVAPHEVRLKRYESYLALISKTEKRKRLAGLVEVVNIEQTRLRALAIVESSCRAWCRRND